MVCSRLLDQVILKSEGNSNELWLERDAFASRQRTSAHRSQNDSISAKAENPVDREPSLFARSRPTRLFFLIGVSNDCEEFAFERKRSSLPRCRNRSRRQSTAGALATGLCACDIAKNAEVHTSKCVAGAGLWGGSRSAACAEAQKSSPGSNGAEAKRRSLILSIVA